MIKLVALKDFPFQKRPIKKGEEFEAENYTARSLIIAKHAVRAGGGSAAPGLYNRRDMRSQDALAPEATEMVSEGKGRSNRGQRG
jgi:hypothetical protein